MMFTRSSTRLEQVRDGASQTLFFGKRGLPNDLGWRWVMCGGSECEQYLNVQNGLTVSQYWSWHRGGVHFLHVDGHVRFLNLSISYNTLKGLATKSSRDVVEEF